MFFFTLRPFVFLNLFKYVEMPKFWSNTRKRRIRISTVWTILLILKLHLFFHKIRNVIQQLSSPATSQHCEIGEIVTCCSRTQLLKCLSALFKCCSNFKTITWHPIVEHAICEDLIKFVLGHSLPTNPRTFSDIS